MTPDAPAPEIEWFQTPTLRGRHIFLEGLDESHAADLCAGADDETVRLLARGGPAEATPDAWANYIGRLNALPNRINFAVCLRESGVCVGRISYSEIRWADRWAEIGTMLLPAAQGTAVNPEAKLLLMARAFEVLGAGRVQFKVDSRNARSIRAMQKLGAEEEGTLRQYQVVPDGFARDSVVFSVLRGEWPAVKAGLETRVAALS
ncbi:GNAT family N-acetyltransferase [Deinococcus sp. AJ005]|uniref:GNAT family N-acetyltransferase n=1 Tax=Deinococcus sp. AJ005 TaxID=2652443 RepID=UPI00125CCB17|nr:GNAT family protein [Deinococcus sp. AJ005]QFP77526.1 GNAT family N-acetyltransferase [Deinococcus sp. AJ005]